MKTKNAAYDLLAEGLALLGEGPPELKAELEAHLEEIR